MSRNEAERFLREMRTNETVRKYLVDTAKPEIEKQVWWSLAQAARKAGYDTDAVELQEAVKAREQELLRQNEEVSGLIWKLSDEALEQAAGGGKYKGWWHADDSRIDGHELFCVLAWHDINWSREHNDWCYNVIYIE